MNWVRYLPLVLALSPLMIAAQGAPSAGGSTPASTSPSASAAPDIWRFDSRVVDAFVPVITMEEIYSPATITQGYRIQLFKDGSGVYQGHKNVKTLGQVEFRITPEQVRKIQDELKRYKFWQVPENQYGLPKGLGFFALEFVLRDGDRTKTVRFDGRAMSAALQDLVESEVRSERWRCPFVDKRGEELCERQQRDRRQIAPQFLKYDLPKLEETYK